MSLAPHYPGELDIAQYLQFHGIVPALHRHRASSADPAAMRLFNLFRE